MVEYLSGNRIQGTSTLPSSPPQTSWKELGRTTLSSAGDTIAVSSFAAKDNLMILLHKINTGGGVNPTVTFNSDGGSNYARRYSANGGNDTTNVNQTKLECTYTGATPTSYVVTPIINKSGKEKLLNFYDCEEGTAGAGNAPNRMEVVAKWANTSAQITSVSFGNDDSGDYAVGSEVVVLGCDNDEADTGTNFWQELANVELSATANVIDSGTITAKKYLWIQFFKISSGDSNFYLEFNSDTGSNYARRYQGNGDSDGTNTSAAYLMPAQSGGDYDVLFNGHIVNKSDKDKLLVGETMNANDEGAGNYSFRREIVGKWTNTSSQITNIKIKTATNNFASGTRMVIWGSD